jgi:hypothetical protein
MELPVEKPRPALDSNLRSVTGDGYGLPRIPAVDGMEYSGKTVAATTIRGSRGWRLCGRERADYTTRYPELDVLHRLPAGTLVDGELVAFDADGRPDLRRLLRRHGLTDPWRIRKAQQWSPVRYVLFDLLYHGGRADAFMPVDSRLRRGEDRRMVGTRKDRQELGKALMRWGGRQGGGSKPTEARSDG